MVELHKAVGGRDTSLARYAIEFTLRPPPPRFTPAGFAARLCQHLALYAIVLAGAIFACLFIFAPLETLVISLSCIVIGAAFVLFRLPARQRFQRLVESGIAASYIAGAAALFEAFKAFLHRT